MADTTEEIFKRELYRRYEPMKRVLISKEQYFKIIDELKQAKSSNKMKVDDEPILYYVIIEDTYDVIKGAHIATGYGGRDRMIKETREALELFKSYCEECQKKRKRPVTKDHLTKFCVLRPLSSKRAAEVAHHLTDIFLLFGVLYILQSDNGLEFTAEVTSELKIIWSKLVLVHGKPWHP
ncbi:KRAB-A domain-containing protein 2-like [Penaeus monodon]|uniref:KRAB-A domain-containing protein 2-like n=1 Tax=Penaeus monodon TaxID=6687 RepID=UPI0018A76F72|nr:KRAB-A domain-containing protein 2-like [Penaeus monodon]